MIHILTICRGGRVRSVAARFWLHDLSGIRCDVIAAGAEANSAETLKLLASWADKIIVCSANVGRTLCPDIVAMPKTVVCDFGPDIWGKESHPDLRRLVASKLPSVVKEWNL